MKSHLTRFISHSRLKVKRSQSGNPLRQRIQFQMRERLLWTFSWRWHDWFWLDVALAAWLSSLAWHSERLQFESYQRQECVIKDRFDISQESNLGWHRWAYCCAHSATNHKKLWQVINVFIKFGPKLGLFLIYSVKDLSLMNNRLF